MTHPFRDILSDLRFALRSLGRRPGYVTVAVLTLALGIGANTAVFSVVEAVLLRPLPYPEPEELVIVWQNDRLRRTEREAASFPDLADWRREAESFSTLAAWRSSALSLSGGDEPERLTAAYASPELFSALGADTAAGRLFTAAENRPGGEPVAVLSHGLWQRRFGADPAVVGRTVRLDGAPVTVVGVAAAGFAFPDDADLWLPLQPSLGERREVRGVHGLLVLGRLTPGVPVAAAQREMTALMARLEAAYPDDNQGRGAFVEPLIDAVAGDVRPALLLLLGAVALVLLVACVNVANLVLARARGRGREMAVRSSLGASRWRLGRLLLVESLALGLAGGAAGLLAAYWGVEALLAAAPGDLPRLDGVTVDGPVLAFALALSVAAGLAAGLLPLAAALRHDLTGALKSGGGAGGGRTGRMRPALVVAEVALSVALVVAAGLLLRSLDAMLGVDPGFRADDVLRVEVALPEATYPEPAWETYPDWPQAVQFYPRVIERVAALPGVEGVALAHHHPLRAGWTTRIVLGDRPVPPPGERDEVVIRPVSAGYFRTLGVALLAGRDFDRRDRAGAADTVIVNRAFAERYFPDGGALETTIEFWGRTRAIVGVVENVRFRGLGEATPPAMYPPLAQVPQGRLALLVRTAGEPMALAPAVREAVWAVDPELALFDVAPLSGLLGESVARPRFQALLLALFAAVALALAAVGIYGVLAAAVGRRTREIGVRMALGAGRGRVLRAVLARGLALTAVATALGLALAAAGSHLLASQLYAVRPTDPLVYATVPALLLLVALAACWLPARRAARVDPMRAIRHE